MVFLSEALKRYWEACVLDSAASPSVKIYISAQIWWLVWIVISSWLYLQAVYRDNGTFFFLASQAVLQPDGSAIIKNWNAQHAIAIIQTIEGILNLILIVVVAAWCVLGHTLLNRAIEPSPAHRETVVGDGYLSLARACLAPVAVFGLILFVYTILNRNKFVPDFFQGVKDILLGVGNLGAAQAG